MNSVERKALTVKIEERRTFIAEAITFAEKLLRERGTQTYFKESSSHTHTKSFVEFGDFRIDENDGWNMYGQGDITISIKPVADGGGILQPLPVLKVSYHGSFDISELGQSMGSEVDLFHNAQEWQTLWTDQVSRKDEILGNVDRKTRVDKKHNIKRRQIADVENDLRKQASLLSIH